MDSKTWSENILDFDVCPDSDPCFQTSLHRAVTAGKTDIIDRKLRFDAHPDLIDWELMTPLHYAVKKNDLEIVELLLGYGANCYAVGKGDSNLTPFQLACRKSNQKIIRAFLDHGCDPNQGSDPNNKHANKALPLFLAIENGPHAVSELVEGKANVNVFTADGITPLHYAIEKEAHCIVSYLLKNGADINAMDMQGNTALHKAVMAFNLAASRILINAGALKTWRNTSGLTPIDVATQNKIAAEEMLVSDDKETEARETAINFYDRLCAVMRPLRWPINPETYKKDRQEHLMRMGYTEIY